MPYRPRPWPTHALWALEDVQALLAEIRALAQRAMPAAADGKITLTVLALSDVRDRAASAQMILAQARTGTYTGGDDGPETA